MGSSQARLPLKLDTLQEKDRHLFVSRSEILDLYKVFCGYSTATDAQQCHDYSSRVGADPGLMPFEEKQPEGRQDTAVWLCNDERGERGNRQLRIEQFLTLPCLRTNPFAPRLYHCFKDQQYGMSFESFLALASAMNHKAPLEIKYMVAFRVFDFDDDGVLNQNDISAMLEVITGQRDLWGEAKAEKEQEAADMEKDGVKTRMTVNWAEDFPVRDRTGCGEKDLFQKAAASLGKSKDPKNDTTSPTTEPKQDPEGTSPVRKSVQEQREDLHKATTSMAEKIFESVDIDESGELSETEFEKVLSKVPDFRLKFSIRIP